MKDLNLALAAVGGLILLLGLLSRPIDRSWLSPAAVTSLTLPGSFIYLWCE